MDLIYTDAQGVDKGALLTHDFDLSYGEEENDFELVVPSDDAKPEYGSYVYAEGTEYGGIVGGIKASTNGQTVSYTGRTWHGILNSKVIEPDSGADYLTVSGDANTVLASLIARMGINSLYTVSSVASGVVIGGYKMSRYIKGYDGIRAMLAAHDAKLHIEWKDKAVQLSAVPVVDYTEAPIDGDIAALTVEQRGHKVNHLICLGKGELAAREVVHLYADADGNIGDVQVLSGMDEITEVYENTATEDLRTDGLKKFKELRAVDKAEVSPLESESRVYDIGDIVGATEYTTGLSVDAAVSQKIVKIRNGVVEIDYKTGG